MDHAEGDVCLQFVTENIEIGGNPAVEYTCDMASAVGAEPLPGMDETMARLFGPGGKLRIQVVLVDEKNRMVGNLTEEPATVV